MALKVANAPLSLNPRIPPLVTLPPSLDEYTPDSLHSICSVGKRVVANSLSVSPRSIRETFRQLTQSDTASTNVKTLAQISAGR
jgi:hypothetical protein